MVCCIFTYLFIAWFIPKTYLKQVDEDYDGLSRDLSYMMNEAKKEEAIHILSQIASELPDNDMKIHIFNKDGKEIDISNMTIKSSNITNYTGINSTSAYDFTFYDDVETYSLLMAIDVKPINQATDALEKTLPFLLIMVIILSFISSFIYSRYLTQPMVKISRISHKLAELDFSEKLNINRTDEIGSLSKDLNTLSFKLSNALMELQMANSALRSDIENEQQAEKKRVAFFSSASHELKTPITIVKGQLEGMLHQVGTYKDRDKYLARSLEVVNGLEKTVQELLIISRMDSPGYTLTKNSFELGSLLEQRLIAHEDLFIKKGITLSKTINEDVFTYADRQLLIKVIDNLISNALNYSSEGNQILVQVYNENGKSTVSIENTGVHIPVDKLPRLFEAFYRVDQSHSRQAGGNGLGLYVVKTILEQHNAYFQIENTRKGVRFYFIL